MTPSEVQLDHRRNAIRDDIADAALEGRVTPRRFVDGAPWFVSTAQTPVYPRPDAGGDRDTEALSGEAVTVFEVRDGWAWVQLAHDLSLIHISEPTRRNQSSRMPSSA